MKKVVFTFGRMNPPTTGHQLLVNKLVTYARQIGAAPRVYLSHSVGPKDPLQYDKKVAFARAAFGSLVKKTNARTVIEVLKQLDKEGFTHVTMFAGSDRVPEFTKLLTKYNGKEYNFESIEVKSAGERDPDADDVSGMSASKMRALAKDDKVAEFIRGAPNTLKAAQAKNMFTAVRKALLGEDVMEYGHNERFLEFIFEGDNKEDDLSDLPSDGEIAKQFDNMDADDLDLDDADAMMLDIILGDEEGEKEEVKEAVLGIQQRQKLAQRMKAMAKRLSRLRQIKAKQMPASQRLKMRARKAALMLLRKRATGKKSLDYNTLSRSQRIAVDTALMQRFGKNLNSLVGRLATRLMPRVRKQAQEYVKKAKEMKEGREVVYPGTQKMVPDQKKDNPLNVDPTKLTINTIDPTKDDRTAPDPATAHQNRNKKLRFKNVLNTEGRKSSADKDARDAGDTNIIYQMRKVVNSRGEHETTFADGKKSSISIADAKKLLAKFDALRLPADKHEFTIQAGKSLASFRDVMAHGVKHQKKGISLGGKKFNEFYLGVGRSRTTSAYDNDEPPGTRRIAEVAKDEDRPEDPNRSRPLSQKMDLLMRLGLVDSDELQKFRRALRSSKKFALQSPQLREKLADLLDKLIDLTTKDPATYSRVRYNVVTKEALSLLNKAEKSGVAVDIIFEVFSRGYEKNKNINEAFDRVNSFIAGGKAADMDKDLTEGKWPYPKEIKGKASDDDSYLGTTDRKRAARKAIRASIKAKAHKALMTGKKVQEVSEPTGGLKDACWSGYTAVGMKMKNGRKVPNCVPKEETQVDEVSAGLLSRYKDKAKTSDTSKMNPNKAFHRREKGPSLAGAKIAAGRKDPDSQHALNRYKMSGGKVKVAATEETQVDEVLDTTTARMDYLEKAGKQMYGKGSADAKSQTFKKRLAGAKLFNRMTDRKPKVPLHKEAVSDDAKKVLGAVAKKHGGKVPFKSTTYKGGKKVVTHGYNDEKGNRVVTHTTNEGYIVKYHDDKGKYKNSSRVFNDKNKADAHAERGNRITRVGGKYTVHKISDTGHEVNEVSSALLHRAFQKAKKDAGWLVPGDKGKGDKAWNRAKKFRDAGVKKQEQERKKKISEGGVRPLGRAYAKTKDAKSDAWEKHASPKNYRKPWEKSKADLNFDFQKAMTGFSGAVKKLPPGKKTPKAQIRPRDYMKPNQASKVGVTEQMSTHEPVPLSKRTKRVKSFHAWHPKPVKEMYTGSEPVSGNRADPANRFVGTNTIRQNYASVTPGQGSAAGEIAVAKFAPEKVDYSSSMIKKTRTEVDQSKDNLGKKHLSDIRKALGGIREQNELSESFAAGFEIAPFARDYGMRVQSAFEHHPSVQEQLEDDMNEAIYQGRQVPLNQPMKGDVKKSKVYVKDPSTGNVKKVNFGDKKLSIKKDQPARKRSYCARSSGQGNLGKKTSANYWSRRAWDC